jgi:hypothetical protein
MTAGAPKRVFAARPGDAERWIKAPESPSARRVAEGEAFSARLTLDVTPALRRRLKLAAVTRGVTVADMLRTLLEREFPDTPGEAP